MYETYWCVQKELEAEIQLSNASQNVNEALVSPESIAYTTLFHWEDHCLECAAPLCYKTCSLYNPRLDKACTRLKYGMCKTNRINNGLLGYSVDLRFKKWGKIETVLYAKNVTVSNHRLLNFIDDKLGQISMKQASILSFFLLPVAIPTRVYASIRRRLLKKISSKCDVLRYDDFLIACFSPDPEGFGLIIEIRDENTMIYRDSLKIEHGNNVFRIPIESIFKTSNNTTHQFVISVYPENNIEARLIFSYLDFVKYKNGSKQQTVKINQQSPKVKCVAWDLDNTIWDGVLLETDAQKVEMKTNIKNIIKKLDERGILQTVVSKNNYDDAWRKIQEFGLDNYFLCPMINWEPKSTNLLKIANNLNINIDVFALIDDSQFEREEVNTSLPQVRVYSDKHINDLLKLDEFNVPVTEVSKNRRQSYQLETERKIASISFEGKYINFLRSIKMEMNIFIPKNQSDIERCLELIQRSNQLNLSTRRYSKHEFIELLANPDILSVAFDVKDRFGSYGIVGFASINDSLEPPLVLDFVLSCRVAQKKVEHTFFDWLAKFYEKKGYTCIQARFKRTQKNDALYKILDEGPFIMIENQNDMQLLELEVRNKIIADAIIDVKVFF